MQTSPFGRGEIARREGTVLTAYLDSVGVWTIGTGHTSAAGEPKVVKGMKITAWEADQILTRDLAAVERAIAAAVKVPLNQNEVDALVSLVFNIGAGAFAKSTLLRKLNAGDRAGAADQFLVWNKGTVNGKKVELRGLTIRRQDERKQFLAAKSTTPKQSIPKASEPKSSPESTTSRAGFFACLLSILLKLFKKGA